MASSASARVRVSGPHQQALYLRRGPSTRAKKAAGTS